MESFLLRHKSMFFGIVLVFAFYVNVLTVDFLSNNKKANIKNCSPDLSSQSITSFQVVSCPNLEKK